MTDTLVQFLRARLDEDEQVARAAAWDEDLAAKWHTETSPYETRGREVRWYVQDAFDDGVVGFVDPQGSDDEGVARHIARHDPARVLAEVDAQRRIVDHVAHELEDHGADNPWWYDDKLLPILRLLALPYAGHLEYREDWRP